MPEQLRRQDIEGNPTPASMTESRELKKSPEVIEDLVNVRETLLTQKSQDAARIAGEFLIGRLTKEETKRGIAKIPDREPLVKKALERLEQMGFVHWAINPEKKTKVLVVDIKKIIERKKRGDKWVQNLGGIFFHHAYGNNNKSDTLYEIFRDKKVISQEDLDQKVYKEKPLFYIPENKNRATTPEEIKKNDFYLGLWDAVQIRSATREYPVEEGRGLSVLETQAALYLFHPRFGDGFREENGVFMIRDHKTREHRPLSWEGLAKYGFSESAISNRKISVRSGIRELLPNLVHKKLLRSDDFRLHGGYKASGAERITRTKVSPDGYAMFNRVKHYLGRAFIGRPIRIYELSESMGGIAEVDKDGKEELRYTFRIFTRENSQKTKSGDFLAGRKETEITPFSPEHVSFPRRADETEEEHKQRIESVQGFSFLLRVSSDLEPLGIALHKEDIREQMVIAKAARYLAERNAYQDFLRFAKKFSEDGVNAFFTAEYDNADGQKILQLADKVSEGDAVELFGSYANISSSAGKIEENLRASVFPDLEIDDDLKKRLPSEIYEGILRRTRDVLFAATGEKNRRQETADIIYSMQGLEILVGTIRSLEDTNTHFRIMRKEVRGGAYVFNVEDKDLGFQYDLRIFVRPRHSPDGQARISFDIDFDTIKPNEELRRAFAHEIFYKKKGKSVKMHRLHAAIDRDIVDGRAQVSFDLGRGPWDGETQKREGDILGKVLAATTELGHHNPKSFDAHFADEKVFEEIANAFSRYIEGKKV